MAHKNRTGRKKAPRPKSRSIGYARVSKGDQELDLQLDALKKQGCRQDRIFMDKVTGARADRPGLDACLATLQPGDTLVVWRLDRLGRSMSHQVTLVEQLRQRGIGFRSICDGVIDTTTASGVLIFNIFATLAQFERRLIQERTRAGLTAARARGRLGGRKPIEPKSPRVQMAKTMHRDRSVTINDICKTLGISRSTFFRYLAL